MKPSEILKKLAARINALNIRPRSPSRPYKGTITKDSGDSLLSITAREDTPIEVSICRNNSSSEINALIQAGMLEVLHCVPRQKAVRIVRVLDKVALSHQIIIRSSGNTLFSIPTCTITPARIPIIAKMLARLAFAPYASGQDGITIEIEPDI